MKKTLTTAALFLIVAATATAQTGREIKNAVYQAGMISKIYEGQAEMPAEEASPEFFADTAQAYSCILTGEFVIRGSLLHHDGVAILPAGAHTLRVQCVRRYSSTSNVVNVGNVTISTTTYRTEFSAVFPIEITLEADKCYNIEAEISGAIFQPLSERVKNIAIVEINDQQKIKKTKAKAAEIIADTDKRMANTVTAQSYRDYLDRWQSNPGALDGTYATKNGKTQIRFRNGRFQAYNSNSLTSESTFLYGDFMFDDRTIIMHVDTMRTTRARGARRKGSHENLLTGRFTNVLYYKSSEETLDILASESDTVVFIFNKFLKDRFLRRADESDAADVRPSAEVNPDEVSASGMATLDIAWQVVDSTLMVTGKGDAPGNPSWMSAVDQYNSAVIGDGVTSLGHHSFATSKIRSIVIGKDVSNLKTYALFSCKNLVEVEVKNPTPPQVGMFVFMLTPIGKARLIVPAGSKAAYQKDKNWKKFGSIEEQ